VLENKFLKTPSKALKFYIISSSIQTTSLSRLTLKLFVEAYFETSVAHLEHNARWICDIYCRYKTQQHDFSSGIIAVALRIASVRCLHGSFNASEFSCM